MHVNVLPDVIDVIPTLVHLAPALAAAFTGVMARDKKSEKTDKNAINLLFIYRA